MFGHYVLTKSCRGKTTSGINPGSSKLCHSEIFKNISGLTQESLMLFSQALMLKLYTLLYRLQGVYASWI